jgi:hypothetical protein
MAQQVAKITTSSYFCPLFAPTASIFASNKEVLSVHATPNYLTNSDKSNIGESNLILSSE